MATNRAIHTMVERPGLPFVWVTWIAGLLAGDTQCTYAPWVKAHYSKYEKRPDTFDSAAWMTAHTALLERRWRQLEAEGYLCHLENVNSFRLKGAAAILAGKPDLIAVRDGVIKVVDAKTGQVRRKDYWQILLYMFALPRVWPEWATHTIEGEAYYSGQPGIPIRSSELNREKIQAIAAAIKAVADPNQPVPTPSAAECRYCDVASCAARIETEIATGAVADF